ncbi:MAG: ABC transporter permease subunit [Firmicutes bacterium]|nr:ABC transporter permease subunit [Bacillota bacterium]
MKSCEINYNKKIYEPKWPTIKKRIYRDRYLFLLLLPVVLFYVVFKYLPMYGLTLAFKDFRLGDNLLGGEWVGFKYFLKLFKSTDFIRVIKNTLVLSIYSIAFGFPVPIILAILINEVKNIKVKKFIQSSLYIPHFISWVILGGILISMLSPSTGIVNKILQTFFGIKPIFFMANSNWWIISFIASGIWREAGWGTIIYLAAMSGIDLQLYEAAEIDGAGRLAQIWHVTFPSLLPTIAIMLILKMGSVMDVGFEQIYILQNPVVRDVSDVISTYVYRNGIQEGQFSITTAIGFFQAITNLILIVSTNKIVHLLGEDGLW